MKRSKPPRRDTPKTRAWLAKPRKPLPKIGRKAKREASAWEQCKADVQRRSAGHCEAGLMRTCGVTHAHRADHVHHIWPEDRRAGRHEPGRCLNLCRAAHRWVHDHPADAAKLGLLRPQLSEVTSSHADEPDD